MRRAGSKPYVTNKGIALDWSFADGRCETSKDTDDWLARDKIPSIKHQTRKTSNPQTSCFNMFLTTFSAIWKSQT